MVGTKLYRSELCSSVNTKKFRRSMLIFLGIKPRQTEPSKNKLLLSLYVSNIDIKRRREQSCIFELANISLEGFVLYFFEGVNPVQNFRTQSVDIIFKK